MDERTAIRRNLKICCPLSGVPNDSRWEWRLKLARLLKYCSVIVVFSLSFPCCRCIGTSMAGVSCYGSRHSRICAVDAFERMKFHQEEKAAEDAPCGSHSDFQTMSIRSRRRLKRANFS
ncbi:hypothetical protein SISSUDRAFT_634645 [Sistotremastrum suecicum HHB10207 ss-3]|uniref:Uncharacterized protein n=1 Tax=Sistotremastrum suecicum HHB10207 ss-3 TaxID=1314776 RepID=A0A166EDW3_9AGAM|nr:hypothetical protein SISSUDRAFT_634645 [Sistotremastrum suecicum HHB10207 ss-3]